MSLCHYYWRDYRAQTWRRLVLLTLHHVFTSHIDLTLPFARPRCLNTVWPGKVLRKRDFDWTYSSSSLFHFICLLLSFLLAFLYFFIFSYTFLSFSYLFKVLRIPILWGAIVSSEHSQARTYQVSVIFIFNNFFHIVSSAFQLNRLGSQLFFSIYIYVYWSGLEPPLVGHQSTVIAPRGTISSSLMLRIVLLLI